MSIELQTRRYHVHPSHERAQGHVVTQAETAQEAALMFIERWAPADDDAVSLIVCDCDTGHQECFRFDLHTGAVAPCA